ncbi:unnamed protein product [Musa acuminata subsp. malaccensis]|uniref:(wild Malaysian banana) hypothetical protein n=1 Tax=Musa acuminata subsp. malaccensis TaxID=214687 RepID=A0A804KS43_MUSAM|nr:unnamed protein product [Musa acuminata subsp. malaccensis]
MCSNHLHADFHVCGHDPHPPRRLRDRSHEHQGVDGLHPPVAAFLLHHQSIQPLGPRLPLPLGRHRLLRRLRHPCHLWGRRLHRRLLSRPEVEERQGDVLTQQQTTDAERSAAAVAGWVRLQRQGKILHHFRCRHDLLIFQIDMASRSQQENPLQSPRTIVNVLNPQICKQLFLHGRWQDYASMGSNGDGNCSGKRPIVHHDDILHKKSALLHKLDDNLAVFHTHAIAGVLGGLTGLLVEPHYAASSSPNPVPRAPPMTVASSSVRICGPFIIE